MVGRPVPIARIANDLRSLVWALFLLMFGIGLIGCPATLRASELHEAVRVQDRAAVEALIAAGADIDERDFLVGTALHVAVSNDDTQTTAILIDHGADLEAASELQGERPLALSE